MFSIILPVLNEEKNLNLMIDCFNQELSNEIFEIVIVDDNSLDNTKNIISQKKKLFSNIQYINRQGKKANLASSILEGIIISKYENLIIMDADFSHPLSKVRELIEIQKKKDCDLIACSRFLKLRPKDFFLRYTLSKVYTFFLRKFLSSKFTDHLCGFYLMKKKIIDTIDVTKIFYGYGDYYIRLLFFIENNYTNISEISFEWGKRKFGYSKSKLLIIFFRYTFEAIKIKILRLFKKI